MSADSQLANVPELTDEQIETAARRSIEEREYQTVTRLALLEDQAALLSVSVADEATDTIVVTLGITRPDDDRSDAEEGSCFVLLSLVGLDMLPIAKTAYKITANGGIEESTNGEAQVLVAIDSDTGGTVDVDDVVTGTAASIFLKADVYRNEDGLSQGIDGLLCGQYIHKLTFAA